MQKTVSILSLLVIAALIAYGVLTDKNALLQRQHDTPSSEVSAEERSEVAALVTAFGSRLQNVSLTANTALRANAVVKEYSPFVTPALLESWTGGTAEVPGRLTSSPWPDRIEITGTERAGENYVVTGEIVLMTSTEVSSGGDAGREPVRLTVVRDGAQWRIADMQFAGR